jgi:proteasome lid subunit RPN8/RPN11
MLSITSTAVARLAEHAMEGYPREVCGLLVGRTGAPGERHALEAHPAANLNLERAHDRYLLDPRAYRVIEADASSRGLEVVGVYHSHPDHPSAPSETDRARAEEVWEELESWSYLIFEITSGGMQSWRSWVLVDRRFVREETSPCEG